jgi:hypothetical protein
MKRILGVLVVVLALAGGTFALAAASGDDERTQASAIVDELSRDQAHRAVTAESLGRAKEALERARRMRAAGDEAHARLADGLALEWAQMAKDLVATAEAEEKAAAMRRDALDAGAAVERERAMLEESITRVGRLRAELDQAQREAPTTNRTAGVDAGARGGHR